VNLRRFTVRAALVVAAVALLFALGVASASAAVLSGTVSGQAPGEEAKPLPETVVTVTAAGKEEVMGSTTADAKGTYSLEVPDGVFDVRFDPPSGYESTTVHEVEVKGSRNLSVVLTSATSVHLTGTLLSAAGDPVPGMELTLSSEATGEVVNGKTAADGSFDLAATPGEYRFIGDAFGPTAPGLPSSWEFRIEPLTLESDRNLELKLPPTSQLVIEAEGSDGAPVPEAQIQVPLTVEAVDLGGYPLAGVITRALKGVTDAQGRATFTVFDGEVEPGAEVVPPASSGYARTLFNVPRIEGDTTVVVQFTGMGEEEPEKDVTGPQLGEIGIEPGSIDTSSSAQEVLVRAHVADDLSGFAEGALVFTSPGGEVTVESSEFQRWNGSALAGDYEIPVLFPQASEPGIWELTQIRLLDAAGNETVIGLEQLEAMEFQHTVQVETPPPAPVATSVSPNFGVESGGTEVQIAGSGFGAGAEVFFGSIPATKVVVDSAESIRATAPAGSGTVDVTVKTSAGVSEAGPLTRYRYSPPVTLKSNPDPSQSGNKVTFTARVLPLTAGTPTPTGTVVFKEGTTTLAAISLSEGKATFSTSGLAPGTHAVTAGYAGDAYFGPGSSGPVIQEVVPKKGGGGR
jgi:Bacterial Ig-like domain (group 3)/IPT/TIG domain